MTAVPVRIPKNLIKKIDLLVKEEDYANRSEAVRAAIRKFTK